MVQEIPRVRGILVVPEDLVLLGVLILRVVLHRINFGDYRPETKLGGKVMFLHLTVILFTGKDVHGRG